MPGQPIDASLQSHASPSRIIDAPLVLLRLEGAALLAAATAIYFILGGHWGWFLALLLIPDVSMVGYAGGPRVGASLYNAAHTLLAPAGLLAVGWLASDPRVWTLGALIWIAHIGMDRLLGFGLKYSSGFRDTHLTTGESK